MKNVNTPDKGQDKDDLDDQNATIPKDIMSDLILEGGQGSIASPSPPETPTISYITDKLEGATVSGPEPDKTEITIESLEVPEDMMSSFFWLEDKFHVWAKSDFGGSLVGFFTRVKMQVGRWSPVTGRRTDFSGWLKVLARIVSCSQVIILRRCPWLEGEDCQTILKKSRSEFGLLRLHYYTHILYMMNAVS